jgi:hypothetical protein
MNAADELAVSLARINAEALARFITPSPSPMAAVAATLADRFATIVHRAPSADFGLRLTAALTKFRNGNRNEVDFRTLRLLCHGCCHYVETDRYVLIGDAEALRSLFGHVAGYAHERRRFRRLVDGLIRAYLGVNRASGWFRNAAVDEGNEALRTFLDGTFDDIAALDPRPDWVLAVVTYRQVLSPDPGQQFAQGWLDGRIQEFQDMAQRLGLSGTAWLITETMRSALRLAVKMPDKQFTPHVPAFLAAAIEPRFQVLSNEIYARLLNRYGELANPTVHPTLRDAVVGAWKNPWLALNDSAWGRVTPKARQMVTSWLKLELIHQFFEVLSEDGRQDKRRFEFWRGYHERMDDVYFALGSRAFNSTHPDSIKLKAALDGRLFELTGTEADTNAFIMCMGDTVVVEFSKHGNAAYRYHRDQLPLDVSHRTISIGVLKHDKEGQMRHAAAQGLAWQERFAQALGAGQSQRRARQLIPAEPATFVDQSANIVAFADKYNIAFDDRRADGGSLWLRTDDANGIFSVQFTAWGFKYSAGKGWWRSQ